MRLNLRGRMNTGQEDENTSRISNNLFIVLIPSERPRSYRPYFDFS